MTGAAILDVLAGALATVQDGGRPGLARLGVPSGGACDPHGLAVANTLLDNPAAAAAVEVALGGFEFRVRDVTVIGLGGADLGAVVVEEDLRLQTDASHLVQAGRTVRFDGRPPGAGRGARAYLAVPGGLDVPRVMGSAATSLVGGFGGLDGRRLLAGDVLRGARGPEPALAGRRWPCEPSPFSDGPSVVRVVSGPRAERYPTSALDAFLATDWIARDDSDRMGLRLAGAKVHGRHAGAFVSQPMTWGAIQVPPDGMPIVLLADHQTVGGYPVLAVVIRADRPLVGQLAPGDRVRFDLVDIAEAQEAWRDDRARFDTAVARLAAMERWNDQWLWAGA